MSPQQVPVNRTLVGVLALGCLGGGAVMWVIGLGEHALCGALVRTGALLGAFWIALPGRGREAAWANVSPWVVLGVVGGLLLVVRRPQVFLPLAAVVAVLALVLRPRAKR